MASRSGAGYLALLLAVVLLWSHGAACAPDQAPLTIITEEWPPYNYAEDGQLKGVSVEVVRTVLKELGRSDPIQLYPSQRAKKMQDALPRTIFFSLFRTKEREPLYKWIGPIGFDAIYFYKRKGDPIEINSLDDARRVPLIACRQAGLVHDILQKEGFTNLDPNAHSSNQVYLKLLKGRSNLAISDSPPRGKILSAEGGVATRQPDANQADGGQLRSLYRRLAGSSRQRGRPMAASTAQTQGQWHHRKNLSGISLSTA